MEQLFLSVEAFNDLLQQWSGQPITITKHEMEDVDEIRMQLQNVSYATNTRRIDGYVPMHALHLNGAGETQTSGANFHPLPDALYEIPLEDESLYEFDGKQFILSTERGVYKIELQNNNSQ